MNRDDDDVQVLVYYALDVMYRVDVLEPEHAHFA